MFGIDSGASSLVTIYVDLDTGQRFHAAELPMDKLAQGTVEEILPILPNLNAEQLGILSGIEAADKSRVTLLDAIKRQLAPPVAAAKTTQPIK